MSAKRIVFSLLALDKPVITKINGAAIRLGAAIALLCEMAYVANHAKIGDPHVSAGLSRATVAPSSVYSSSAMHEPRNSS